MVQVEACFAIDIVYSQAINFFRLSVRKNKTIQFDGWSLLGSVDFSFGLFPNSYKLANDYL